MREMILNHASLDAPNKRAALGWLKGMAAGMSALLCEKVVSSHLRMQESQDEIHCLPNWTLAEAYRELRHEGARDEYLFLVRLSSKVPLLSDVSEKVISRFRGCEDRTLPAGTGDPLVLCAITDGVAVGFPSDSTWVRDELTVTFDELLYDGEIETAVESIDNLTRECHACSICARHRQNVRHKIGSPTDLWQSRESAFPNLLFSSDVETQLNSLQLSLLQIVVKRLIGLDESVGEWRRQRTAMPRWRSKITSESRSVVVDNSLRSARRFRSIGGNFELFMWHARYGSAGRIHFRVDGSRFEIEIGYIGNKLPTAKFRT